MLNTGTWNIAEARERSRTLDASCCNEIKRRSRASGSLPDVVCGGKKAYSGSIAIHSNSVYALVSLEDAQTVFIRIGEQSSSSALKDVIAGLPCEGCRSRECLSDK